MTDNVLSASEFKATCLGLLDLVRERGESYIVTKHGRPVARLVPLAEPPSLRGSVRYEDDADLLGPVDVTWEADA